MTKMMGATRSLRVFVVYGFSLSISYPSDRIKTILRGLVGLLNKEAFFHEWKEAEIGDDPSADVVDVLMKRLEMLPEIDKVKAANHDSTSFKNAVIFLTLDSIIVKDIEAETDLNSDAFMEAQHFLNCFVTFCLEETTQAPVYVEFNVKKGEAILTQDSFYFTFPAKLTRDGYLIEDLEKGRTLLVPIKGIYQPSRVAFSRHEKGFEFSELPSSSPYFLLSLFRKPMIGNATVISFPNLEANTCKLTKDELVSFASSNYIPQQKNVGLWNIKRELHPLQERINELDWTIKQSVRAAEPEDYNPIDKDALERWVNAHEEGPTHRIARKLADGLIYVTFDKFKEALIYLVGEFNDELASLPEKDQAYILLRHTVEKEKSDEWVAALALPYLKKLPSDVVLDTYLTPEYLEYHSNVRRFLIFDDATYSGQQLAERIKNVQSVCKRLNEQRARAGKDLYKYEMDVIVPYMNVDPTECLWATDRSDSSTHFAVIGHVFKKDFTVGDVLGSPEDRRLANALWWPRGTNGEFESISSMPWLVFQHKVADAFSLPHEIIRGGLVGKTRYDMAKELIPEIRKQLENSGYIRFDLESLKKYTGPFVDTNLVPPYKTWRW